MLVVVVVISVLAALVGPNILKALTDANASAARSQVEMLSTALDAYRLEVGTYPTTTEGLRALVEPPSGSPARWKGPYLRKSSVPLDPWGNPYVYRFPGEQNPRGFDLLSYGEDGRPGGEGDAADILGWM
jgi:general secretion pathway protein G